MDQFNDSAVEPQPPILNQIYDSHQPISVSASVQQNVLKGEQAIELWQQGRQVWNAWADSHEGWSVDFSHMDFSYYRGSGQRDISFKGYRFPGKTQFEYARFGDGVVTFAEACFIGGSTSFVNVEFGDGNVSFYRTCFSSIAVLFDGTHFGDGHIYFNRTGFGQGVISFNNARFGKGSVHFNGAQFGHNGVSFKETRFGEGRVSFAKVQFGKGGVSFEYAEFGTGNILFDGAVIGDVGVSFRCAKLGRGDVSFRNTRLGYGPFSFERAMIGSGNIYFSPDSLCYCQSINFSACQISGVLNLTGVKTRSVINFCYAKFAFPVMIDGTQIDYRKTLTHRYLERAVEPSDVSCFRRLKHMALASKNQEQALEFFVKEKRSSYWHSIKGGRLLLYYLYDWCSDFGRSVIRPVAFLLTIWLSFACWYVVISEHKVVDRVTSSALAVSAGNTLPVWALSCEVHSKAMVQLYGNREIPPAAYYAGATQNVLSGLFIFLIGLALRNRFRQ